MDWIWIVIFIVIALAKGFGKLSEQSSDDAPEPPPAPVPRRPSRPQEWHAGQRDMQDFMKTLASRGAPPVIPVAQPVPPPAPVEEPSPAPPAPAPAPAKPSCKNPWAEALRDRQNVRNIIISAEIIGPPKSAQY